MSKREISPALESQLIKEGVDLDKMYTFLKNLNGGTYDGVSGIVPETVPSMPHPSIVDRRGSSSWTMPVEDARSCFASLGITLDPKKEGKIEGVYVTFEEKALEKIGVLLYPQTAYGVLNGGSASSYADVKKNMALDPHLFEHFRSQFDTLADECRGKPKGITPAFINKDGSAGWSFLFLKLRMLLEHKKKYRDLTGHLPDFILPSFQMTSVLTDEDIANAFTSYVSDPAFLEISEKLGCSAIEMFTETQTLMAAITHSSAGLPRRIFDKAWGKPDTGIAMPGGHGQNFEVLAPIYRKLLKKGIRYAWLGNIDNMGYTVDPISLAIFALSGKDAAFEESWRTPMDVKGGILVCDAAGKFSCADIGPVISTEKMLAFEAEGKSVLFNCGIGLFDLQKLVPMLDEIPYTLPLRITDQDKDAGKYAQAEQITWEIIGMFDNPLFFAVEKNKRFLAAKMLMETLLTSLPPEKTDFELAELPELAQLARVLHEGQVALLKKEYGLVRRDGVWELR